MHREGRSFSLGEVGLTIALSEVDGAQLQELEACRAGAADAVGPALLGRGIDLRRLDDRGIKVLGGRDGLLGGGSRGREGWGRGGVVGRGSGREHQKVGRTASRKQLVHVRGHGGLL